MGGLRALLVDTVNKLLFHDLFRQYLYKDDNNRCQSKAENEQGQVSESWIDLEEVNGQLDEIQADPRHDFFRLTINDALNKLVAIVEICNYYDDDRQVAEEIVWEKRINDFKCLTSPIRITVNNYENTFLEACI